LTDSPDLAALCRGDKPAWDNFVRRYAGLIVSAVKGVARDPVDIDDLVQDVFVRLCKDGFRLMKTYDPQRAGLSTWLTIVARSTARDTMRRRHLPSTPIESVPESLLSVAPKSVERILYPDTLLSPRQKLVLTMLYDHDMDVADAAQALGVDPQTIRSTHHKAMLKLRSYFRGLDSSIDSGDGGSLDRLKDEEYEDRK
jgi:RNA polymerase sigma factor (sigma-70 family)